MDGTFEAEGDPPTNFVDLWNGLVQTNDMVNTNTGKYDPRHLYGTSNQDVFRWPSIRNGTEKQVLALYVISLLLPGIPILTWGEEQAFYLLDNSNANYGEFIFDAPATRHTDSHSFRTISYVFDPGLAVTRVLQSWIREVS
jgi:glycosidase